MKSDALAAFRAAAEVPDHRHDEAGPHRIACPVCGRGCRLNRRSGSLPRHRHYPGGPWCTLAGKRPLTQSEIAAAEDRERGPSDEDREACCAAQMDAETEAQTEALAAVVAAEHSARKAMIAVTTTLHEATRAR